MVGLETRGNTGTWVTTGVHDVLSVVVLGVVEQRLDSWLSETPCTRVQRLLLCPHNRLGVGVAVKVVAELRPWEGVQLLDTCNGNVLDVVVGAVFVESRIDLACAENDTLNLVVASNVSRGVRRVRDDPLEMRLAREVTETGASKRMTQQRFREEDDKSWDKLVRDMADKC